MSKIIIKDAVKKYGENTVVSGLNVEIADNELFTLLGPSGCGKTTLLRMIAGFNSIEGGDFYFNEKRINDMAPEKRNIGMVFQNYAIFPHLTVRENVEFGWKNRKYDKALMTEETDKFLKSMKIDQFADRLPEKLSGGQQQRVALARALVIKPDVLLMDEPLSNLDAKLRLEMRRFIRKIQKEVGITTVYVTHDQEEAMAISDKIAVMKDGVIQHLGTPEDIYMRPKNTFVANFIGTSNFVNATLVNGKVKFNETYQVELEPIKNLSDQSVIVSVRPEEFTLAEKSNMGIQGIIKDTSYLGMNTHYFVEISPENIVEVIQESKDKLIPENTEVTLFVKPEKINIFDERGSENLLRCD